MLRISMVHMFSRFYDVFLLHILYILLKQLRYYNYVIWFFRHYYPSNCDELKLWSFNQLRDWVAANFAMLLYLSYGSSRKMIYSDYAHSLSCACLQFPLSQSSFNPLVRVHFIQNADLLLNIGQSLNAHSRALLMQKLDRTGTASRLIPTFCLLLSQRFILYLTIV